MKQKHALLWLCLAQIFIGVNVVSAKHLVTVLPVSFIIFLRFGISSVLLHSFCLIRGKSLAENSLGEKITLQDVFMICLQGLSGGVLYNFLVLTGLRYTDAATAGIISATTPAMIAFLSYWLLKETLSQRKIFTIIFAVLGIVCLHLSELGSHYAAYSLWGNLLVVASIFPEAMFTIIAKKHNTPIPAIVTATICNMANALFCLPIVLSMIPAILHAHLTLTDCLVIAAQISSGIGFYFGWYQGLPHVPASTAALVTAVAPISITLLAIIFLGERINILDSVGMILVLMSICYGAGLTPSVLRSRMKESA